MINQSFESLGIPESATSIADLVSRSDAEVLCEGIIAEGDEALSWVKDRASRYKAENGLKTRQSQALASIDYLVCVHGHGSNETRLPAALRAARNLCGDSLESEAHDLERLLATLSVLKVATPRVVGGLVYWVQREQHRATLIEAGVDEGLIYSRDELGVIVDLNRDRGDVQPVIDAKTNFSGKIGADLGGVLKSS